MNSSQPRRRKRKQQGSNRKPGNLSSSQTEILKPPVVELENCLFLDPTLVYRQGSKAYPKLKAEMERFVDALAEGPLPEGLRAPIASGRKREPDSWRNVETLLANLHAMDLKEKSTLALSRSPKDDSQTRIGAGIINLVNLADDPTRRLLVSARGFRNHTNPRQSRRTRIQPTPLLRRLFDATKLSERVLSHTIISVPDHLIELRKTNRKPIFYTKNGRKYETEIKDKVPVPRKEWEEKATPEQRRWLRTLEDNTAHFNDVLERYEITYCRDSDQRRDPLYPALHCIFNNDWEHGGRFYTGWGGHQGLSKAERATIEFNEQPSIELDYGGLHIRMLYHMAGGDYPLDGDPYKDVLREMGKDYDQLQMRFGDAWAKAIRDDLKRVLLMLVNGTVKDSVKNRFKAMARQIKYNLFREWERIKEPKKKEGCRKECDDCLTRWRESGLANGHDSPFEVVKAFARVHQPIEYYFMTGCGLRLQNIDARIAFHVMQDMMDSPNQPSIVIPTIPIPTLPIHDSFITFGHPPWPQRLENSMRKWYRHVMQKVTRTHAAYEIPIHKPGSTQDYVRETG